jgi:hypothetical protein
MARWTVAIFLFLVIGCVKTQEHHFTAIEECRSMEELNDPGDARDEYDKCLIIQDEELKSKSGCRDRCMEHCSGLEMAFENSWTDFAGCRCTCKIRIGGTPDQ